MKFFKKLIIALVTILLLLAISSVFLPSNLHIERSQVIPAPKEVLFEQVNTIKNWEKWSPWQHLDPNMKTQYNAIPSGVGASYSWQGNDKVGQGKMTITQAVIGDSLALDLDFMEQGTAKQVYVFEKTDNGTKITLKFDADMSKPPVVGKYFAMIMKGMLIKDFDRGLSNLDSLAKTSLPKQATPLPVIITQTK
jgi:Polyketide cyclase / dehydrase and lipid transport